MNMVIGFLVACLLTVIVVRLLYPLALKLEWIDRPDGVRKRHDGEIPLIGGPSIILGYLCAVLIMSLITRLEFPVWSIWLIAVLILAMVGGLDDFSHRATPTLRALAQVVAALIAAWGAGIVLQTLGNLWGDGPVRTGLWAVPFTVLSFVGVTNSFNLLDGVDGLAGLVALAPLFWIILFALGTGRPALAETLLLLAGSISAFLGFNFDHGLRKRRIFLGSIGATFIGFTLAWILVRLSQAGHHPLPPIAAVWIMGFPILDTVNVMVRRIIRLRHPLYGGRDHLHHFWLHRGRSERWIAIFEAAATLILGGVGYLGWLTGLPGNVLSLGFIGLAVIYFAGFEILDHRYQWAEFPMRGRISAKIRGEGDLQ